MKRVIKSVKLVDLITEVNRINRESICSPEERRAVNNFLEGILYKSGAYMGYVFLKKEEVPKGQKPGYVRGTGKTPHKFPDDTRINYLVSPRLLVKPEPKKNK